MTKRENLLNYQVWLFKARGDLKSAKTLSRDDEELLSNAIFCTQQCAEKALKAYLVFRKKPLQKTHDLNKLIDECSQLEPNFSSLIGKVSILDPYATRFRYPDDYLIPEKQDLITAIEIAEEVLEFVRKRITYESHPNLKLFIWLLMFLGWKGGW